MRLLRFISIAQISSSPVPRPVRRFDSCSGGTKIAAEATRKDEIYMTIEYETLCPVCLYAPERFSPLTKMVGEITDEPFVEATCSKGHSLKMYPTDGKFSFIFTHAVRAFHDGYLYEAASSGYAALEEYMKNYIQACNWQSAIGSKENISCDEAYTKLAKNKFLMSNSQRIMGAYSFMFSINSGEQFNQRKFETMSRNRDKVIHAAIIPDEKIVNDLLVGIFRHINESIYSWVSFGPMITSVLPEYNTQLAMEVLAKDFNNSGKEVGGQDFINRLAQTPPSIFVQNTAFENDDQRKKYIGDENKNINTADDLFKRIPDLNYYS